ncbi:phage head morphogenesis protein [Serratia ficaria]|uniref:phage head morphogenesis protein n=1 Tax=Serratia ficaria TaxID=61651 RepID=UPI0021B74CF3|nr:phage minor head protein [Serratia ficaria]
MMARVWLHPYGIERDFTNALVRATRQFNKEINSSYGDIRFDGWQDDLGGILAYLRNAGNRIFQPVIERLPSFFALTSQFNDKQWRLIVKGGTGVDLPPSQAIIAGQTTVPVSSGALGVDSYRAEPWLREMQELWVSENTRLIKSIPADELSDMEGIIQRGVMNGSSADTIKKQIQDRYGVTERRAKLIAVDQIGKANSALTKQRQSDAGISGYKWRGVLDERERPEHRAREGNSYKWNNPPPDGHPGQPMRCRCYAEPDWTGSVFDIGE